MIENDCLGFCGLNQRRIIPRASRAFTVRPSWEACEVTKVWAISQDSPAGTTSFPAFVVRLYSSAAHLWTLRQRNERCQCLSRSLSRKLLLNKVYFPTAPRSIFAFSPVPEVTSLEWHQHLVTGMLKHSLFKTPRTTISKHT